MDGVCVFFFLLSAGELSKEEIEKLVDVISNPLKYNIPNWFLNRQRDFRDNSFSQIVSNDINSKLRDDLERLRKIRSVIHIHLPFLLLCE